jgi:hypothetical protein
MVNMRIIAVKVEGVYPILWIAFVLLLAGTLYAQEHTPGVISADNIEQLTSVARIDFDALSVELGGLDLGWFALSPTANRLAVRNRNNELVILNPQGDVVDIYSAPGRDDLPATVLEADFSAEGNMLASAHLDGMGYVVAYRDIETGTMQYLRFETTEAPIRIWTGNQIWLEISPVDPLEGRFVIQVAPDLLSQSGEIRESADFPTIPSGPEHDPDAFLRIGRIKPPTAITVTQAGLVKRWNLETGEVTATAHVDVLTGAGQVNASGRYFVWRDAESANLYLLDFETGENRLIVSLDGTYIPFLFLSTDASIAIGVNVGSEPTVVAWDTATGERYDLGEYRACNRQPDMVRLSRDGTTLVIGCDTGLDIWRVEGDER